MLSLHHHSNYSILEATIPIEKIIASAKLYGERYAVLTDTNGMYGSVKFAKKASEENIKPILGVLIDDPNNKKLSAIFIAKNLKGYSDISQITTSRKIKEDFSLERVFDENLENVFVITSSLELLQLIYQNKKLKQNLFVELIATKKHKRNTRELYEFAKSKDLQFVASNPVYFFNPEDHLLQKVVTAIKKNTTLENLTNEEIIDDEYYFKSPSELEKIWRNLPEAILNTKKIANMCNVDLEFGRNKFPKFDLPKGENAPNYLRKICNLGLAERYKNITAQALARLDMELNVIEEMGFSHYFLVVHDIVREAKLRRMKILGRGSAANSFVSYCLGFTDIDPIKYNLYFERFLNRARTSPPDIDLDFSWRERDEIVKYVYEKYGYDKVAMISTTVTFRARSAFRETAKVFGISEREISQYSKFIPWTSAQNLVQIAEKFPESKNLNFKIEPWKTIIQIASQLSSFPHHLSIHPSGIVVTEKAITNYVPLEYAKNKGLGLIITQPDMYGIEDLGLVKIDLLSQRSLEVLKNTMSDLEGKYFPDKSIGKLNIINIDVSK